MIWDIEVTVGQPDAVPAHLVDQIFSHDDDLLAAVLNPDQITFLQSLHAKQPETVQVMFCPACSPAWVGCKHGARDPLLEVLCDVICQRRPERNTVQFSSFQLRGTQVIRLEAYLGRMVPGPGSSGPGTNTKRLLRVQKNISH